MDVMRLVSLLALLGNMLLLATNTQADSEKILPAEFVYLQDIDPTIVQDIRYAHANNFVGRTIKGYDSAECIITRQAGAALTRAQINLRKKDIGLKVLDCYRPAQAVADFVKWSGESDEANIKNYNYPTLSKAALFELGYISAHSRHTSGSTVDVTLVSMSGGESPDHSEPGTYCHEESIRGSLNMGTDFDCFHPRSNFAAKDISKEARANRDILRRAMIEAGFVPYDKEWWHFTLGKEPYPNRRFDFPISPR